MIHRSWAVVVLATWGVAGCGGDPKGASACVVARQVDACCSEPVVVPLSQLESDPCVQLVSRFPEVAECPAASDCLLVVCAGPSPISPRSRVATPDGNGACTYADECETDADCIAARNRAECCSCPVAIPRALVQIDPCWVPTGSDVPAACDACEGFDCQACPAAPAVVRCVEGSRGFRACVAT